MKKIFKIIGLFLIVIIVASIFLNQNNNNNNVTINNEQTNSQAKNSQTAYTISDIKINKDSFSTTVEGILTNNTNNKKNYVQISFDVKDQKGNKVGNAFANISGLEPNGTWKFKAIYMGSEKDISIDTNNPEVTGF